MTFSVALELWLLLSPPHCHSGFCETAAARAGAASVEMGVMRHLLVTARPEMVLVRSPPGLL